MRLVVRMGEKMGLEARFGDDRLDAPKSAERNCGRRRRRSSQDEIVVRIQGFAKLRRLAAAIAGSALVVFVRRKRDGGASSGLDVENSRLRDDVGAAGPGSHRPVRGQAKVLQGREWATPYPEGAEVGSCPGAAIAVPLSDSRV